MKAKDNSIYCKDMRPISSNTDRNSGVLSCNLAGSRLLAKLVRHRKDELFVPQYEKFGSFTMNPTRLLLSAVAACALSVAPAMAQSAGTSATGTSNGMQGTPGEAGPSSGGGAMKGGAMSGSGAGMKGGAMSGSGAGTKDGAMSGSGAGGGDMGTSGGGAKN